MSHLCNDMLRSECHTLDRYSSKLSCLPALGANGRSPLYSIEADATRYCLPCTATTLKPCMDLATNLDMVSKEVRWLCALSQNLLWDRPGMEQKIYF